MDNATASEVAGMGVGALLLCAAVAAPKVDAFISSSQRRSLGMCERCGDLRMIACSICRGVGMVRDGGLLGLVVLGDVLLQRYAAGGGGEGSNKPCTKCQAKGRVSCPVCSNLP